MTDLLVDSVPKDAVLRQTERHVAYTTQGCWVDGKGVRFFSFPSLSLPDDAPPRPRSFWRGGLLPEELEKYQSEGRLDSVLESMSRSHGRNPGETQYARERRYRDEQVSWRREAEHCQCHLCRDWELYNRFEYI